MAQNFDPQVDGFSFVNYWTLDQATRDELRNKMTETVSSVLGFLPDLPPLAPLRSVIQKTTSDWVSKASTRAFGLCGGMAFAALDYYKAGRNVPNEPGPTTDNLSPALRSYILGRMKDSFMFVKDGVVHNNLGRVLAWMAVEWLVPLGEGQRMLLHWTVDEFRKLQGLITANGAWPLALIGEAQDPCENHQVLAYKFDSGAGANAIYVYDMNHPGAGHKISLDFSGSALKAVYDFTGDSWQPLRGFFCEDYAFVRPTV